MSTRKLVKLQDRYPNLSRMSIWRMRQDPRFPDGVIVLKTEHFYEDEMEAYDEARRRRREQSAAQQPHTAAKSTSTT